MRTTPHLQIARLLLGALVAVAPALLRAQDAEPSQASLDRWQPGLDLEAKVGVNSAEPPLLYSYELWLVPGYVHNLLEVTDDSNGITGSLLGHRLGLHLGGSMTLWRNLQLGVNVPVVLLQARGAPVSPAFGAVGDLPVTGVGDLSVLAKYHLLSAEQTWVNLALLASVSAPNNFPRDAYLGERTVGFSARAAVSREIEGFGLAAELGYHWRPTTSFLDATIGPELRLGLGASYDFEPHLKLPMEVALASHMGTRHDAPFQRLNETPNEVMLEVSYRRWLPLVVSVGMGAGVVAGVGTPDLRALVSVRWSHRPDDRDGDRIPDHLDECPDVPEDYDWIEDGDGCPEEDRDDDGISDRDDQCPDDPETDNDFQDEDGCPDSLTVIKKGRIILMEPVLFEYNKAVLKPESKRILDEVVQILEDNPQIEHLRIEGHTDSDGGLDFNDRLSRNRAMAVRLYLISNGIKAKRLSAKGYGERKPIASNDTDEGKQLNRRVEFLIEGMEGEGGGDLEQE